jgi:hypothetical protein
MSGSDSETPDFLCAGRYPLLAGCVPQERRKSSFFGLPARRNFEEVSFSVFRRKSFSRKLLFRCLENPERQKNTFFGLSARRIVKKDAFTHSRREFPCVTTLKNAN